MKFYCDSCNTKYSIADDKVRGKILKVRCKSCGHIITVREAVTPAASAPSAVPAPPKPATVPQTNWHYSLNGNTAGPFDLGELCRRYASGELGDETYVWHETLVAWKPVRDVSAFEDALRKGQAVKPRSKTLGFTGPLEAIKATSGPSQQRTGVAPQVSKPQVAKPQIAKPEVSKPAVSDPGETKPMLAPSIEAKPTPEAKARSMTPMPAARQERLDQLRDKLKPEPAPSQPVGMQTFDDAPTSMLTFAPGVQAAAPVGQADVPRSQSAIDLPTFDLPPSGAQSAPDPIGEPQTSSRSDILNQPVDLPESPNDSGVIPFFPDVPKLDSAAAPHTSQTTTGSLLIEMGKLKKEGRTKVVWAAAGGGFLVCSIVAAGIFLYMQNRPAETTPEVVVKPQKREIKEKVYSKKSLSKFGQIELDDEVMDGNVDVAELELAFEDDEPQPTKTKPAVKTGLKTPKPEKTEIAKVKKPDPKTPKEADLKVGTAVDPDKKVDPRTALLAYSGSKTAIARPEDKLAMGAAMPTELSKEAAKRGFQRVTKSVAICRERHARRAKFEAKKIMLTVVVEPTGRVSTVKLKPSTMNNTEFDKCMNSHRGRWKFAPWEGSSVEINRSFVMQ